MSKAVGEDKSSVGENVNTIFGKQQGHHAKGPKLLCSKSYCCATISFNLHCIKCKMISTQNHFSVWLLY